MTFAFRSVFFSVLCLSLMSFSCASTSSASRSSQLEGKISDQHARMWVEKAVGYCNDTKQTPTEVQCEGLKDKFAETGREQGKKDVLEINKICQEYRLSEDDCNLKKEKRLREISTSLP